MISIRKTLPRRLSIAISLLIVAALLITDIAVDGWVERQFNHGVHDKVGLLETLVDEDTTGVEFEFAGEYYPEFTGTNDPEYFQLWYDGETFEKSATLHMHSMNALPFKAVKEGETVLEDIVLPDGRNGRIAYTRFIPQIDTENREAYFATKQKGERKPMTLAYAVSIEQLQYSLWLIDAAFILALIIVPLTVRFTVKNTVAYALTPLDAFIGQIRNTRLIDKPEPMQMKVPVEELLPVVESLNYFIAENSKHYQRERRLTSDIAHELKTPVTELITMAEIATRFPGDEELEAHFKPDVLTIGLRMKSIISGLMLLHKYSNQKLACADIIDVCDLLTKVIDSEGSGRVHLVIDETTDATVKSNLFALESVFTNLIANALQYSPTDSKVTCNIEKLTGDTLDIVVSNTMQKPVSDEELQLMFEPLWQHDPARTSTENFGLGLAIVKTLLKAVDAGIKVSADKGDIAFRVSLPV